MATTFAKRTAFLVVFAEAQICPLRDANVKEPARQPGALVEN